MNGETILDETILLKAVIGLKWIVWGPKNLRLERSGKIASQGPPPKDPLQDETILFKTVSSSKWIILGSGKIAFGAIEAK